jgi:hypothetical protein
MPVDAVDEEKRWSSRGLSFKHDVTYCLWRGTLLILAANSSYSTQTSDKLNSGK